MSNQEATVEWLSVSQAADRLGVSTKTVRRLLDSQQLPGYRLGGKLIRIKASDLALVIAPYKPNSTTLRGIGVICV
jgi:excisionase family DNA binding protein